ncbi:MAG: HAMP domain-containing sensor histidine kinase [Gammaproteobacteria bacterium]|nr:HAMP domain-containing sensor histidine kinase [Gammaproteobacteria bacterium]
MKMFRASLTGLDKKRLAIWLTVFFLVLVILTGILVQYTYSQLKWETFNQYRLLSQELANRVDDRFSSLIEDEESRSFVDYTFLNVAGDPSARFVQRSPLAQFPVDAAIPGMIGYFQVDTEGVYSTPLLPDQIGPEISYGITESELQQRQDLAGRIRQILNQNQLVAVTRPSGTVMPLVADTALEQRQELALSGSGFRSREVSYDKGYDRPTALDEVTPVPQKQQALAQAAFDSLNKVSKVERWIAKKNISNSIQSSEKTAFRGTKVEDLDLAYTYQQAIAEPAAPVSEIQAGAMVAKRGARQKSRAARQERNVLPELSVVVPQGKERDDLYGETSDSFHFVADPDIRITTFQSEIDPFEISLLESGHFVLFRKVWKEGQRFIQGMLIEQNPFLIGVIEPLLQETAIAKTSDLIVVYQGNVFSVFRGGTAQSDLYEVSELKGELLHRARFSAPMGDLELMFLVNQLPVGPGGTLIIWVAILLTVVLLSGFTLMYWLGVKQIDLTRQQQDFVAAVTHELNTPLTSIRMYGEMLRDGWAPEEKIKTYYEFICDESERLTRLITNVLQLARMTRNDLQIELKEVSVSELVDVIRSKISSQIERAGFKLNLTCDDSVAEATVNVDADYFNQIVINLVDNAIKFSARSKKKDIDISFNLQQENRVAFRIRDYGPGVSSSQMKKIFKLFYRAEDKFIRETKGTGIGLSLVNQLATAMDATVDVVNKNPGAEFRILF